jgi:hypothetical protein
VRVADWPVSNEALLGEMETVSVGVRPPTGVPPPQPAESIAANARMTLVMDFLKSDKTVPLSCSSSGRTLHLTRR